MKKFLLVFALCCSLLLSSCNLGAENLVDEEIQSNESFAEEIVESTTEKPRYVVDYFDMTMYDVVQELGEHYILMGYQGGTDLHYSEIEFVLGQIYNFSGREKAGQIIVYEDFQLDDVLYKDMTYLELSDVLGDSVSEPKFYENMLDGVCSYRTEFDYNGYSYLFEWECDNEGQIEYNDRTCDCVIISNFESKTIQYDDCLFDYGSCEDAKAKIDLDVLGYEGYEISPPESDKVLFINNEKYYVFYICHSESKRRFLDVYVSAQTNDVYTGKFFSDSEPHFYQCYSNSIETSVTDEDFIYYGTTEQNCFRYYTKDFR